MFLGDHVSGPEPPTPPEARSAYLSSQAVKWTAFEHHGVYSQLLTVISPFSEESDYPRILAADKR